jgi:four helix bundle protein
MQDFRNLKVWSKAHGFTLDAYRVTRGFPADERFGLVNQMRRACASIGRGLRAENRRRYEQICTNRDGFRE